MLRCEASIDRCCHPLVVMELSIKETQHITKRPFYKQSKLKQMFLKKNYWITLSLNSLKIQEEVCKTEHFLFVKLFVAWHATLTLKCSTTNNYLKFFQDNRYRKGKFNNTRLELLYKIIFAKFKFHLQVFYFSGVFCSFFSSVFCPHFCWFVLQVQSDNLNPVTVGLFCLKHIHSSKYTVKDKFKTSF